MAACLAIAPAEVVKQNAQMLRASSSSSSSSSSKPNPGASLSSARSPSSSSSSARAFRALVAGPGAARKLWAGYSALVARNLPFTALQFPVFEHVRAAVQRRRAQRHHGVGPSSPPSLVEVGVVTGASAGLAGGLAAWLTTPLDVVKTRMMLSAGQQHPPAAAAAAAAAADAVTDAISASSSSSSSSSSAAHHAQSMRAVARETWRRGGPRALFRGAALRASWTAVGSGLYLGTYEVAKVYLTDRSDDVGIS
jgi:hypothetical protein